MTRMRVVATAALCVTLAACGTSSGEGGSPSASASEVPTSSSPTSASSTTPGPELTGEAGFLDYLHRLKAFPTAVPDAAIVRAGQVVCQKLDAGEKPEAVGQELVNLEFSMVQAASLIIVAVKFQCPSHVDVVPAAKGTLAP